MRPLVYIVIVNWNNWRDTVECLESIQWLAYDSYRVIVVDNASTDQSVQKIEQWARGDINANLDDSPVCLPRKFINTKLSITNSNKKENLKNVMSSDCINLIAHTSNDGFAAGCNIGINIAMQDTACRYIWLLNNDTVVDKSALGALVNCMIEDSTVGMCGSTLLYYHHPNIIQAKGGAVFNKWAATSRHIGEGEIYSCDSFESSIRFDYVVGASMLVSVDFIKNIGLLDEDYFLYFEEIDWAVRGRQYKLAYAASSIVYHKEGGTTKLNKKNPTYGKGTEIYLLRNRLVFTRKNMIAYLPSVAVRLIVVFLRSLTPRRFSRAKLFFRKEFWSVK